MVVGTSHHCSFNADSPPSTMGTDPLLEWRGPLDCQPDLAGGRRARSRSRFLQLFGNVSCAVVLGVILTPRKPCNDCIHLLQQFCALVSQLEDAIQIEGLLKIRPSTVPIWPGSSMLGQDPTSHAFEDVPQGLNPPATEPPAPCFISKSRSSLNWASLRRRSNSDTSSAECEPAELRGDTLSQPGELLLRRNQIFSPSRLSVIAAASFSSSNLFFARTTNCSVDWICSSTLGRVACPLAFFRASSRTGRARSVGSRAWMAICSWPTRFLFDHFFWIAGTADDCLDERIAGGLPSFDARGH